jgi:hypothetical protein
MIMRMMMTLTGFILAMLGAITFMHSDHQTLGLLICVGGIFAMHEGLPKLIIGVMVRVATSEVHWIE